LDPKPPLVEGLPYGASRLKDRSVARGAVRVGVGLMAFGAALFAVGWRAKANRLLEIAFGVTVVGWMALVIGSAFWLVSMIAERVQKKPKKTD
jgi:hypothetical protein